MPDPYYPDRLPEKVLQFGSGILLRGLPDYFIDKANRAGVFNGRILVVKSTGGEVSGFSVSGFDTYVRGIVRGKKIEEKITNRSISRTLAATTHWPEIMEAAHDQNFQIIISNTTEVGLQYTEESIFQSPPASFPGKLVAFLYERFQTLGNRCPDMVVIPTELIPANGEKLKAMTVKLIAFNQLEAAFSEWMSARIVFCNSLVDRIVTRPSDSIQRTLAKPDTSAIQTEPYRLWAVEGDERVRKILSFASTDENLIVAQDIDYYRERKLRLLNGTHTISVCLGFLKGHDTVLECMEDPGMNTFMERVMMDEILPTLLLGTHEDNVQFGNEVLDRFRNPFTEHKLLSITLQSTMKMRMRVIPVMIRCAEIFGSVPPRLTRGFAAWLLFLKSARVENGRFFGRRGDQEYLIQDDEAGYFYEQWQNHPAPEVVKNICSCTRLWDTDLSRIPGFAAAVLDELVKLQTGMPRRNFEHSA